MNLVEDMSAVLEAVTVDCPPLYLGTVLRVHCRVVQSEEPAAVPAVVAKMDLLPHL